MSKNTARIFLTIILLVSITFRATALEVQSVSPISGVDWTFETTRGFQNLSFLQHKDQLQKSQLLDFKGILFHSYHNKHLISKAQLNLGFLQIPHFLWSWNPNFNHDAQVNQSLLCIEFDGQIYFPRLMPIFVYFTPYIGYAFFEYSFNGSLSSKKSDTLTYNSVNAGIQYTKKLSKDFSCISYIAYTPFMCTTNAANLAHYIHYGTEIITDFNLFGITVFLNFKRGFPLKKTLHFFDEKEYIVNTSAIGFSFHLNFN